MTERGVALLDEVTERLRALLEKRGVEWWETVSYIGATITDEGIERHYLVSTWWNSPVFGSVEATDMGDGVLNMACLNGCNLTPEQAISATLGRGECHMTEMQFPHEDDGSYWLLCDQCGFMLYMRDWWQPVRFCSHCGSKVVDE